MFGRKGQLEKKDNTHLELHTFRRNYNEFVIFWRGKQKRLLVFDPNGAWSSNKVCLLSNTHRQVHFCYRRFTKVKPNGTSKTVWRTRPIRFLLHRGEPVLHWSISCWRQILKWCGSLHWQTWPVTWSFGRSLKAPSTANLKLGCLSNFES
jgi:hypothetical protein